MRKTWTSRTINKDITLKSDISAPPTVTDVIRPYTTVLWVSAYTDIFITCCGMEACKTNSIIPFNKCPQTTCVYPPVTTTLFTLSLSVNTSEERSRCRSQMWKYVNASISAGRLRNPYSWHTVTMGWGSMDLYGGWGRVKSGFCKNRIRYCDWTIRGADTDGKNLIKWVEEHYKRRLCYGHFSGRCSEITFSLLETFLSSPGWYLPGWPCLHPEGTRGHWMLWMWQWFHIIRPSQHHISTQMIIRNTNEGIPLEDWCPSLE